MNQAKKILIIAIPLLTLAILVIAIYSVIKTKGAANNTNSGNINTTTQSATNDLATKIDTQDGLSFEVVPLDFSPDKQVRLDVKITTHSGSLDFDPKVISTLEDDHGNQYAALDWQGSGPGGHHRSGTLLFPKLNSGAKKIKLIIEDAYIRIFEWDLL